MRPNVFYFCLYMLRMLSRKINPTKITRVTFQLMPYYPNVCFLCQAQVQEDVPEVRLAAGTSILLLLIPLSYSSDLLPLLLYSNYWISYLCSSYSPTSKDLILDLLLPAFFSPHHSLLIVLQSTL